MGKKKKVNFHGDSQHSPSTVFVSSLPFSFTNAQLEETFSELGPIRRCFMVTKKGSTEHRGFGFVQFASVEDANRAVEVKDGSTVGGRKIAVKHAMHRAPLEQRRAKKDLAQPYEAGQKKDVNTGQKKDDNTGQEKDDDSLTELQTPGQVLSRGIEGRTIGKRKRTAAASNIVSDGKNFSEKQRVARTVIVGGLLNADMAEEIHHRAREFGDVSSVTYPLQKEVFDCHGLAQEGCKRDASSIVYTSIKAARTCVSSLHQKEIHGETLWVRQLGGEGSKTQKWKVIVRNLPFKAKVDDIKDLFSSAGFVWDVSIPRNAETGLPKGFAFIKFTSKQDAENAIKKLNGREIGKRPIAVDWAVPKKIYTSSGQTTGASDAQNQSDVESDDSDSENSDLEAKREPQQTRGADVSQVVSESSAEPAQEVDFEEEADVARKVLLNLISSTPAASAVSPSSNAISLGKLKGGEGNLMPEDIADVSLVSQLKPRLSDKREKTDDKSVGTDDLQCTIFISNLPFDIDLEEVKLRFSSFGEVISFVPVLHQITKRPKGTGFLKFKTAEAADAAVSAANTPTGLGIFLKGRLLKVLKALDKNAARVKDFEKTNKEDHDHRNLYLAKEGLILEDSPAAEGVSQSDMAKRKALHEKKMVKLKSPNFHVSKTRLIVYNVPASLTEKELKKLCIDAVTSRATKQKPTIRQIKCLKDTKNGKPVKKKHSRGVAFVEFTEHQHALVALRVLNNNPETFGMDHRPIVEFALDNVQTLKQRKDRLQGQTQGSDERVEDGQQTALFQKIDTHSDKPSKRGKLRSHTSKHSSNNVVDVSDVRGVSAEEDQAAKRQRSSSATVGKSVLSMHKQKGAEERLRGDEKKGRPGVREERVMQEGINSARQPQPQEQDVRRSRKRNSDNITLPLASSNKVKHVAKKKDPVGQDMVDKLDMLIEQYKSKFTQLNQEKKDGNRDGSKRLRRWFQS